MGFCGLHTVRRWCLRIKRDSYEYFKNNNVWANEDKEGKEDDIEGFGQLVALLLVGVPLLQVLQIYCGKSCMLWRLKSPGWPLQRRVKRASN